MDRYGMITNGSGSIDGGERAGDDGERRGTGRGRRVTSLSRVVAALRLRHPGQPNSAEQRHATWLELFFDLVFVLALSGVTGRLGTGEGPSAGQIGTAAGIYVLVQWAWIGQCYYDTRFDPDDVPNRLIVLVATAGVGAMALGVRHAPVGLLLPAGYLVVRGALLLMYLRVLSIDRSPRPLVAVYGTGFGIGWLLWLGSLALPPTIRPVLWVVALAIELATPWSGRHWLNRYPVDTSHLPERLGQLTIILLGATLTNLRDAVPGPHPPTRALVAAGVALLIPISIWWVYTTFVTSRLAVPRLGNGQAYGYLHAPTGAAILFLGWALGEFVRAAGDGAHRVPDAVRPLCGASIVTFMLCGAGLQWFSLGHLSRTRLAIAGGSIAPIVVVTVLVGDPMLFLVLVAVVMVGNAIVLSPQIVRQRDQR
jgi:low temperature requirement protein LtrA